MTRRRVLVSLWVVAAALAIALVLGTGRLWGTKAKPSAVASYITSVDGIQQQMRLPLTQLLTAFRDFSTKSSDPRERARLSSAESTLREVERRLSALPAPPQAAKLRKLLLELVQVEDAVTVEVDRLGRFMPSFQSILGVTATANKQLSQALTAAAPPKAHRVRGTTKQINAARAKFSQELQRALSAQADAVDAYGRALGVAVRALLRLRPPAVMAPAFQSQVESLAATRRAGAALAAGLRAPPAQQGNVQLLSRRFTVASRLAGSVAAQRAEIAAVKAYNARVRRVGDIQARIRSEMTHLQLLAG